MALSNTDITRQGTLKTAAHRIAVDTGNRHATEIGQRFKRFSKCNRHLRGLSFVTTGKTVQIRPCTKELFAIAMHHQSGDLLVGV